MITRVSILDALFILGVFEKKYPKPPKNLEIELALLTVLKLNLRFTASKLKLWDHLLLRHTHSFLWYQTKYLNAQRLKCRTQWFWNWWKRCRIVVLTSCMRHTSLSLTSCLDNHVNSGVQIILTTFTNCFWSHVLLITLVASPYTLFPHWRRKVVAHFPDTCVFVWIIVIKVLRIDILFIFNFLIKNTQKCIFNRANLNGWKSLYSG